jgi:hypothetical protein
MSITYVDCDACKCRTSLVLYGSGSDGPCPVRLDDASWVVHLDMRMFGASSSGHEAVTVCPYGSECERPAMPTGGTGEWNRLCQLLRIPSYLALVDGFRCVCVSSQPSLAKGRA